MTRSSKLGIHSVGLNFFLSVLSLRKLENNPAEAGLTPSLASSARRNGGGKLQLRKTPHV